MNFNLFLLTVLLNVSVGSCNFKMTETQTALVNLTEMQEGTSVATFAGGCFWCTEAVFERVIGVRDVVSGYTGGKTANPTYKQVSYGESDHAEAVQVYYDSSIISYEELLEIFFATHNPTQLNRQGPDVGEQYRSEVFYHDTKQKKAVEKYIQELEGAGKYKKPIVTAVSAFDKFYLAEKYHQNYFELNPGNPYIISIAKPKVAKFKKYFPGKVKEAYR